jgi:hypothetical protein
MKRDFCYQDKIPALFLGALMIMVNATLAKSAEVICDPKLEELAAKMNSFHDEFLIRYKGKLYNNYFNKEFKALLPAKIQVECLEEFAARLKNGGLYKPGNITTVYIRYPEASGSFGVDAKGNVTLGFGGFDK